MMERRPKPFGTQARAISLATILFALGLALSGCGGSERLDTAKVIGTVTLDGRPLSHGTVSFTPNRGRAAQGEIHSDGSFKLGTYGKGDGAIIGQHQVAVICIDREELVSGVEWDPDRPHKWLIPQGYGNPATSGLTFEVKAGTSNVAELTLSSGPRP